MTRLPSSLFRNCTDDRELGSDTPHHPPFVATEEPKNGTTDDVRKFQGTWNLISIDSNGEVMPPETLKDRKLIVKGDGTVFMEGDQVYSRSTQKLDATTTPKQLDIRQIEGPYKGKLTKGIDTPEGDELTICYVYPGDGRPTDFKAGKDSGRILLKFRREKR